MQEIEPRVNLAEEAIEKQAPPFLGKPRFSSIVYHSMLLWQDLELTIADFRSKLLIANANPWALGVWAKLLEARYPVSDLVVLRKLVLSKAAANQSKSTVADVTNVARQLWGFDGIALELPGNDTWNVEVYLDAGIPFGVSPYEKSILSDAVPGEMQVSISQHHPDTNALLAWHPDLPVTLLGVGFDTSTAGPSHPSLPTVGGAPAWTTSTNAQS